LIVLNRKNKETGFSTYLKNLPRIRYLFPKNRVTNVDVHREGSVMDIHRVHVPHKFMGSPKALKLMYGILYMCHTGL